MDASLRIPGPWVVHARRQAGRLLSQAVTSWTRLTLPTRHGARPGALPAPAGAPLITSFFARRNGVAAGGLMQADALRRLGAAPHCVDATTGIRNPIARWDAELPQATSAIVHADGRMVAFGLNFLGPVARRLRRIGYCAWELGQPPADWAGFDRTLHEVWVPSRFSAEALREICQAPVHTVPHVVIPPAESPEADAPGQAIDGPFLRDEDFVVLAMADLRSSLARKNPQGAIEAFRRALGHRPEAVLVLKLTGASHDARALEQLRQAAQGVRVVWILEHLSEAAKWRLIRRADVFLSLHRAEGYGLPMAEAMAAGRVVVGTAWSGNLDFMHTRNAVLVPSRLVDIHDPQGVYAHGEWAEPDLDVAAQALAQLHADPALRAALGERAAADFLPEAQLARLRQSLPASFVQATRGLAVEPRTQEPPR